LATTCHILKPKCTKFDFGWAAPKTPLGELTVGMGRKGRNGGKERRKRRGSGVGGVDIAWPDL